MMISLRQSIRALGRPMVAAIRRALTPSEPTKILRPMTIQNGPAAGLIIELPSPSKLADTIINGEYESHCVTACELFVRPEDVCLDIGAHYGFYTLLLSRLAKNGCVHAYEPVPKLAESIGRSIQLSDLTNAKVRNVGVSDASGHLTLRYAADQSTDDSMNYLLEHGGVSSARSQQQYSRFSECPIECRSLDDLDISNPGFIKIDAEGAEAAILLGGQRVLSSARPRMLIELHGVDLTLKVSGILRELGYTSLAIGGRDLIMSVLFVHLADEFGVGVLNELLGIDVRQPRSYFSSIPPR